MNKKGDKTMNIIFAVVIIGILFWTLTSKLRAADENYDQSMNYFNKLILVNQKCESKGAIGSGYIDYDGDRFPDDCDVCIGDGGSNKGMDTNANGMPDACESTGSGIKPTGKCKFFNPLPAKDPFEKYKLVQCCTVARPGTGFECQIPADSE